MIKVLVAGLVAGCRSQVVVCGAAALDEAVDVYPSVGSFPVWCRASRPSTLRPAVSPRRDFIPSSIRPPCLGSSVCLSPTLPHSSPFTLLPLSRSGSLHLPLYR